MNRRIVRRVPCRGADLVRLGAILLLAATLGPAPAPAEKLSHQKLSHQKLYVATKTDCLAPGFEELSCGALGTYFVGPGEDCGQSRVDLSGAGLYLETPAELTLRSADSWSPCAGGSCFTSRPTGPWVAVVDWANGHGESVGETVLQASGDSVEARLFPLGASGLERIDRLPAVNDVHVLAQLCHVAGAASVHPPLAVNMSFGRLDLVSCEQSRSIACELDRVIGHLARDLRIPLFAAAGNEGQLLYPAAHPRVIAVGSVDISRLAAGGRARPLPQAPPGFDALLAGQGLYLEERGGRRFWAAPPGSSYANALAAGWWAAYRLREPKIAEKLRAFCDAPLVPKVGGGRIGLGCGALTFPGSDLPGPRALLEPALGRSPEVCGPAGTYEDLLLDVAGPVPAGETPRLTLADVQIHLARPAPDSRPCVPCHGSGGGGDNGGGGSSSMSEESELTVDLFLSAGVPEELELLGVYLQVGRSVFRFSDSENPILLGRLALGDVERLTLRNLPHRPGAPLAFVYTLRLRTGGLAFRSTTPILVHEHRKEI